MRQLPLALAFFVTVAAAPVAAHADSFNYTISTGPSSQSSPAATFNASGTFTGTATGTLPASIVLSGVTGSAQGYTFTGVVPTGAVSGITYDDLLFTDGTTPFVDGSGILLYLTADGYPLNSTLAHVYNTANGYRVDVADLREPTDSTPFSISTFTVSPTAVPEPASLALFGTGALGLLGAARRKLSRS